MSFNTALKRTFISIGDALVRVALRFFVTEERGSPFFHGIFSPKIRVTARGLVTEDQGSVLEIGCGDGRFVLPVAQESGRPVVGLDLFEHPFDAAVEQRDELGVGDLQLLRGSGMDLPFHDATFDNVVCVNTLNSMPEHEAAWAIVREMVRVCKPGGTVVVDYRNASNPLVYYRFKWRRAKYPQSGLNQITFRYSDMAGILGELGCRVVDRKPLFLPCACLAPAVVLKAEKGA